MPPPEKRTCLTTRNKREADQRQQTSNRVIKLIDLEDSYILIHLKNYPEKEEQDQQPDKHVMLMNLMNTKLVLELKTHWCGDFNVAMLHGGERREFFLLSEVTLPLPSPLPLGLKSTMMLHKVEIIFAI